VFAKALRPLNNNVNGVGNGHAPDDE